MFRMDDIVIKKVVLNNFRSHERYVLDCNKKTTLILGENGCGKTSVLEAIYIAMQGKSFRATDREIIKRKTGFYRIELEYISGEKTITLYDEETNKKTFLIRDKKTARLPKKQKYPTVLFLPEDLHLIATSPTRRRDYFDRVITQLNERYNDYLLRYNKALKQRNELLKQEKVSKEMVFSWDILMAKYGVLISKEREKVVEIINKKINDRYNSIAKNKDVVELRYKKNINKMDESEYLKLLELDFERDKLTGHTNFGVHKDDFEFFFNNSLADGSASRGEVRSMILALKFIEAEELFEELKKKPIVLLDDVFSELDKLRQKRLVENFKNHQVILTSVEGV